MRILTTCTSSGTLKSVMAQYIARLGRKAEAGMRGAASVLMEKSLELVPKDTEALAHSARITQEGTGLEAKVFVGYGGRDIAGRDIWSPVSQRMVWRVPSDYAKLQHFTDMPHPRGGQMNFLGEPSKNEKPAMAREFLARFNATP